MTTAQLNVLNQLIDRAPLPPHARHFMQGPASVALRSDNRAAVESAADTLYAYGPTAPGSVRWTVAVHTTVPVDTALAATEFSGSPTQDIGPRLRAHSLPVPDGRAYWVPDLATIIHLDRLAATITVYCPDQTAGIHWTARLVRQTMTAQLLDSGAIYAHAAAFVHHGFGVVIAGQKGAGKTTTLLTALRMLGGQFVTNDRLLLHHDGSAVVGHAWPTHMRVGIGTLLTIPELGALVPAEIRTLSIDQQLRHPVKLAIEPCELRQLLGNVSIGGAVRPQLMLWPSRSSSDARPDRVPVTQVHDILQRTKFFMHDPEHGTGAHINHWLLGPAEPDRATTALHQIAGAVARTVPCFRMPVTNNPTALADRIERLLAAHRTADSTPLVQTLGTSR